MFSVGLKPYYEFYKFYEMGLAWFESYLQKL
jgi:hypothetical protein